MAFKKWKEGKTVIHKGGGGNAFYGLGGIGVLIYYLQMAHSFTDVVLAFIKAILWPAFLAYRLFGFLGMN